MKCLSVHDREHYMGDCQWKLSTAKLRAAFSIKVDAGNSLATFRERVIVL